MLNSEAMVLHFPAAPVVCYPPALDTLTLGNMNEPLPRYDTACD